MNAASVASLSRRVRELEGEVRSLQLEAASLVVEAELHAASHEPPWLQQRGPRARAGAGPAAGAAMVDALRPRPQ